MDFDRLTYKSELNGVGGCIKDSAESFIVQEIGLDGTVYETGKTFEKNKTVEKFLHIILQKKNWTTEQAVSEVAKRLGVSQKRFSWAGTKDRNAVTTQLISLFAPEEMVGEKLDELKIRDIELLGWWGADRELELGELSGNSFRIFVGGSDKDADARVNEIYADLNGVVPNYFGPQRFGTRQNNHKIGKAILQGNFYEAVMLFLTSCGSSETDEIRTARKELSKIKDFKNALAFFPRSMQYELRMIEHLASKPGDYVGALRNVHRSISLRFVHAYQSYLFNLILSKKLESGTLDGPTTGPEPLLNLIGYETVLSEEERALLENEGLSVNDFRIRSMPELSSKGSTRAALVPIKGFSYNNSTFSFDLPKGAFATSVLREFIDRKQLDC